MRVDLTDREAALIVRVLRAEEVRLDRASRDIARLDGGDACDGVVALCTEVGDLARTINAIKLRAGGANS